MEIIKTTLFARCAISAIIALSLSLVSGCATSKIIKNSKGAAGLQQKIRKSPIHWEFTLTSKHGEIKKIKNNQPLLVLNDKHMNKVIMFSKEPFHFVKKITPKQSQNLLRCHLKKLKRLWKHLLRTERFFVLLVWLICFVSQCFCRKKNPLIARDYFFDFI